MNLNASPFAFDQDLDHPYPQIFGQGTASSSSSISCHFFLNNSTPDHSGYFHHQLYQPDPKVDDAYAYSGGSSTDKAETSGLKLTLRKNEPAEDHDMVINEKKNDPVKWMSSKMRLMHKMKNTPGHHHRRALKVNTAKPQASSSVEETDHFSSKNSSYNNNSPIRVCGDCNTTKTPLWRSGPKGPKSLCNACGIRQRKARRALAAAQANGTAVASDQTTNALKIKLQNKDKTLITNSTHGSTAPLKKRYKMAAAAAASSTTTGSRTKIEDFLMNFSKNLAFHRVFPEDEKDAAILLMALSSGLVHG